MLSAYLTPFSLTPVNFSIYRCSLPYANISTEWEYPWI
jgi:hypothetical protein